MVAWCQARHRDIYRVDQGLNSLYQTIFTSTDWLITLYKATTPQAVQARSSQDWILDIQPSFLLSAVFGKQFLFWCRRRPSLSLAVPQFVHIWSSHRKNSDKNYSSVALTGSQARLSAARDGYVWSESKKDFLVIFGAACFQCLL